MDKILYKNIQEVEKIKEINKDDMTITHYISTSTPDRFNEVMNPKGCDSLEYRKNPVVFFGHRSRDLPIARNEKLIIDDSGILAVTKFDTSEFAKEVFRLNAEGFLNSWSIGFLPLESPKMKDNYLYFDKWKLLEYSSVPIPANPDAVNLMLKEVKNEQLRTIIERYSESGNGDSNMIIEIENIKNNLSRIQEESTKNTREILKAELTRFEDRLVRKLNNIINSIL
jgi:HK97 family phage prohead protease